MSCRPVYDLCGWRGEFHFQESIHFTEQTNQSISLNRLIFVWSAFVSGPPKTDPLFGHVLQVMSDLLFCNAQLSMGK